MKKLFLFLSFTIFFFSCTKNEIEDTNDSRFYRKWSEVEFTFGMMFILSLKHPVGKIIWEFQENGTLIVRNYPTVTFIAKPSGSYSFLTKTSNNKIMINGKEADYKFVDNNNLEIFKNPESDGCWSRFVKYSD